MFKFDMNIDQNFASFFSKKYNKYVFVESFDNTVFLVRMGTLSESKEIGVFVATTSEELNAKLRKLCSIQKR